MDHQFADKIDLILRQVGLGLGNPARPFDFLWRYAQHLPRLDPIARRHSLAIKPQLPGPRPARHDVERHIFHMAFEPAVDPDIVIIGRNRELPDIKRLQRLHLLLGRALGGFFLGAAFGCGIKTAHAIARTAIRPANNASTEPITESRA